MQFVLVILQIPPATPIFFGIENHDRQDQGEKPKKIAPTPERCREAAAAGPSVLVLDLHENIDNPAVGSFRSRKNQTQPTANNRYPQAQRFPLLASASVFLTALGK